MDSHTKMKLPEAPIDSVDPLLQVWHSTAIQVMQPVVQEQLSAIPENLVKMIKNDINAPLSKMEMDHGDSKPIPPWRTDDIKSWIWMQKAMHPELNYDRCFRKKWLPRKFISFKQISIRKWVKEMKEKRKEEERLQKAEAHAAVSIASIAAALAAVAAENVKVNQKFATKEAAVASAAALVAEQCAQMAESMGVNRKQLSAAMSSAMVATGVGDILTLTAAAATSLKGAATLRARPGNKERKDGDRHILPIEGKTGSEIDYKKYRDVLEKGAELNIRKADGGCKLRLVSITLNSQAKVILKTRKTNVFKGFVRAKKSIIFNLHEELIVGADGSPIIAMTTSGGTLKLEMKDIDQYKMWIVTINHVLMLSTSFSGYELQFYRN